MIDIGLSLAVSVFPFGTRAWGGCQPTANRPYRRLSRRIAGSRVITAHRRVTYHPLPQRTVNRRRSRPVSGFWRRTPQRGSGWRIDRFRGTGKGRFCDLRESLTVRLEESPELAETPHRDKVSHPERPGFARKAFPMRVSKGERPDFPKPMGKHRRDGVGGRMWNPRSRFRRRVGGGDGRPIPIQSFPTAERDTSRFRLSVLLPHAPRIDGPRAPARAPVLTFRPGVPIRLWTFV